MRRFRLLSAFALLAVLLAGNAAGEILEPVVPTIDNVAVPPVAIAGVPFRVDVEVSWAFNNPRTDKFHYSIRNAEYGEVASGSVRRLDSRGSLVKNFVIPDVVVPTSGDTTLWLHVFDWVDPGPATSDKLEVRVISGWITVLPVVFMVVLATISRQVYMALYSGIFLGCLFIFRYNPVIALIRSLDTYMVNAISAPDHAKVILFTFWLSVLVALVRSSGGAQGLAKLLQRFSGTRWSAQWATYALGWIIFFDDYASCLITGTQMRSFSDMAYVSREKLAFLTHATAAPPASIIPPSSWIGFELALISSQLRRIGDPSGAFSTFIETIPSQYYALYMMAFVAIQLALKREFGPMLSAERRVQNLAKVLVEDETEKLGAEGDHPVPPDRQRWYNAVVPVAVTIVVAAVSLLTTGYYESLEMQKKDPTVDPTNLLTMSGNGDSYGSLIWASIFGCFAAMVMYKAQNVMTIRECVGSWIVEIKGVMQTYMTLICAWTMCSVIEDLGTSAFITSAIKGVMASASLPTVIFVFSCVISFCSGTSWGTMAIMFPLAVPVADALLPGDHQLVVLTLSAILNGSICGGQCSPISDTTVLSASSAGVSVTAHVCTQLPYAALVAIVSVCCGYLPVGLGAYPAWAGLLVGVAALSGALLAVGCNPESAGPGRVEALGGTLWGWLVAKTRNRRPSAANSENTLAEAKETEAGLRPPLEIV